LYLFWYNSEGALPEDGAPSSHVPASHRPFVVSNLPQRKNISLTIKESASGGRKSSRPGKINFEKDYDAKYFGRIPQLEALMPVQSPPPLVFYGTYGLCTM